MDCINPSLQRQQLLGLQKSTSGLVDAWRQCRQQRWEAHPQPSARRALNWLIVANVPIYLRFRTSIERAHTQALNDFEGTFSARWIAYFFPGTRAQMLDRFTSSRRQVAMADFGLRWGLTPFTVSDKKWWTWFTAGFTHASFGHLASNMTALYTLGNICARIPGMTARHMWSLAIGAGVCSNITCYLDLSTGREPRWIAFGASGIVCAFGAVACLGFPREPISFGWGPVQCFTTTWSVSALALLVDLIGWGAKRFPASFPAHLTVDGRRVPGLGGNQQQIGHAAHLGGVAFGVFYYLIFLRSAAAEALVAGEPSKDRADPPSPLPKRTLYLPSSPALAREEPEMTTPLSDEAASRPPLHSSPEHLMSQQDNQDSSSQTRPTYHTNDLGFDLLSEVTTTRIDTGSSENAPYTRWQPFRSKSRQADQTMDA